MLPAKVAKPTGAAAGGAGAGGFSSGGSGSTSAALAAARKLPSLEDLLTAGDYTGAATLMDFKQRTGEEKMEAALPWIAYSWFHMGEYGKALEIYDSLIMTGTATSLEVLLNKAACLYYLGRYEEAEAAAASGPECSYKTRLLFHISNKLGKDSAILAQHKKLTGSEMDQLSLAAMQYMRVHYPEAAEIYKKLLVENKAAAAVNVYMALCYYRMDYYEVSNDFLGVYLQAHPSSIVALNLKACNQFRLYNGKAAEMELKPLLDAGYPLEDSDLLRHNLVVFRNGEHALRVLPPLMPSLPEARLNLAIYQLRQGAVREAYELLADLAPTVPQEYILKAVVHATVGQLLLQPQQSQASGGLTAAAVGGFSPKEHLKLAEQYFHTVGVSASECDTIPGRQSMASSYFLSKGFESVNVYLGSIKAFLYQEDDFNWNYGLSLAAQGQYKEAEETLLQVHNPLYLNHYIYCTWLARCHIMNRKPRLAWEIFLRMDSSAESLYLLKLIASDCYRMGCFFFAAKAFDVLERLEPEEGEYWEGKKGACCGVLQQVVAGQESKDSLKEVLVMLRNSSGSSSRHPHLELISRGIARWLQANGGL